MIIDRSHRSWAVAAAAIAIVSGVLYVPYASRPAEPSGGSWPGLAYGVAGFGLMLYAGLLGARKKVPVWRLGRAQTWMRGHLWLGLVSLPLIVFHAGFTFGSGLAAVLMWLLVVVVVSGVAGAYLQHTLPRKIMRDVPMETIYEQIDHVRAQLLAEADTVVADACGRLEVETVVPVSGAGAVAAMGAESEAAMRSTMRVEAEESAPLREFYLREVRPFVATPHREHPLADPSKRALMFEKVRALVPPVFHAAIADLENICEEERQLMVQSKLYVGLHAWLLVHVPLSIALLVLAVVHIVMALRY